jgi:hypothetical protein
MISSYGFSFIKLYHIPCFAFAEVVKMYAKSQGSINNTSYIFIQSLRLLMGNTSNSFIIY